MKFLVSRLKGKEKNIKRKTGNIIKCPYISKIGNEKQEQEM